MYESYWQLAAKPFEHHAEPKFYYPSESHQAALLKLRYAIENRRGAALLAAPSGLGKTLIVQTLARQLGDTYRPWAHLVFPQMPPDQFLVYLVAELTGQPTSDSSTIEQSVRRLRQFLSENRGGDRHAVVVIDEAHLLAESEVLDTIRLLLNFQHDAMPAWTILLVGQPALLPALDRFPELDDRLDVKCLLPRFDLEDTISYVSHRLHVAGCRRAIFEPAALEVIHQLSAGIPRRINRLADLALLVGFAEEYSMVSAAHIEAVAEELVVSVAE